MAKSIVQVRVHKRPNMFKVQDSLYNLMGYGDLEKMYTDPDFKSTGTLHLWFPERFLNIVEQRKIVMKIEAAGYTEAVIETQSPFIIQCSNNVIVYNHELPLDSAFKNSTDDLGGLPSGDELGCIGGTILQGIQNETL